MNWCNVIFIFSAIGSPIPAALNLQKHKIHLVMFKSAPAQTQPLSILFSQVWD